MVYNPQPNHQPTFGYSSWHSYGWITVNRPLCSTDRQHFIPAPAFVLFPLQHLLVGTAQRFDSTGNILQVPPEITDHSYSAQVFFLTCKPLLRTKHGWSFDMCIQHETERHLFSLPHVCGPTQSVIVDGSLVKPPKSLVVDRIC